MNMRGLPAIQKYVSGGEINSIYEALFGRPVDAGGAAWYGDRLAGTSYEDAVRIIAGGAVNSGEALSSPDAQQRAIDDFNALLDKGYYSEAAAFATNAGVDPDITANYVNETRGLSGAGAIQPNQVSQLATDYINLTPQLSQRGNINDAPRIDVQPSPSVTRDDVLAAYSRWLNRAPSEAEIQGWLEYSQANDPTQTANAFIAEADKEARDILRSAYGSVLGRDPDESEIQGWIDRLGVVDAKTVVTEWQNLAQQELDRRAGAGAGDGDGAGADTGGGKTDLEEAADAAITGGTVLSGPGQYSGVPLFERQQPSALTFQPIQRGLAQLRGPAYMRGLTTDEEFTPAFGGTGLPRETIVEGLLDYGGRFVPETAPDAEAINREIIGEYIRNEMVPLGLSPAEVAAANPNLSLGATQQFYNEFAPQGMFSTAGPQLAPQDPFVLQTGAYTPNVTATNPVSGLPYVGREGGVIKMAEGGEASSNISTYIDRLIASGGTGEDIKGAMNLYGVTPAQVGEAYPQFSLEELTSAYENLQASPAERIRAFEKRYSTEEALRQAGSKFDISEFIDDQGRLVGGYSKPMYDRFNRFIGYEYQPYERDVVFGETLRGKEAGIQLSDADQEQILRDLMIMRGQTGVGPSRGGLAGIEVRGPAQRNRPLYYPFESNYAKGGLASVAQDLADKGRFGDTMVAHISPQEAGLLKAMGGSGTINPETGLPEFFKLFGIDLFPKKGIKLNLGPLGNIKVGRKSSDLLLAAAAGYAGATGFMGLNPATAGLAYGGVRAAATGNLQEGIMSGLSAYGMGSGFQQMGVQPASATGTATGTLSSTGPASSAVVDSANVPIMETTGTEFVGPTATGTPATSAGFSYDAYGEMIPTGTGGPLPGPQIVTPSPSGVTYGKMTLPVANNMTATAATPQTFLRETLPASVQEYTPDFLLDASGTQLAVGSVLGSSLIAGQQERAAAAAQQAALNREREERKKRFQDLYARTLGAIPAREGGLMKLAKGGMTYMEAGGTTGPTGEPRDVTGTGDGMSDSVPANIEGVQEARLADGEFVIPADVVADIGNGSSDAGSKKLYDMMDRIRMARHGTKEQPPEIKAERLMPA